MDADLLVLLAAVSAWTSLAFWFGCWTERRRDREAGAKEPPTSRQLAFIADLADELETMPIRLAQTPTRCGDAPTRRNIAWRRLAPLRSLRFRAMNGRR